MNEATLTAPLREILQTANLIADRHDMGRARRYLLRVMWYADLSLLADTKEPGWEELFTLSGDRWRRAQQIALESVMDYAGEDPFQDTLRVYLDIIDELEIRRFPERLGLYAVLENMLQETEISSEELMIWEGTVCAIRLGWMTPLSEIALTLSDIYREIDLAREGGPALSWDQRSLMARRDRSDLDVITLMTCWPQMIALQRWYERDGASESEARELVLRDHLYPLLALQGALRVGEGPSGLGLGL